MDSNELQDLVSGTCRRNSSLITIQEGRRCKFKTTYGNLRTNYPHSYGNYPESRALISLHFTLSTNDKEQL
ncbi:hypothetical protein RB195_008215 [Necator americanus]|uniref:Uncharacterized protein n=1 Tax=Necator americanus TaxID=51031 RepID=A0ABR1CNG6_NECAM